MPEKQDALEARVEEIEKRLHVLSRQVEELTAVLDGARARVSGKKSLVGAPSSAEASEKMLDWVGRSSFLPRVSAICFILVVALLLRTVTDNEILDQQVGSVVGMLYAAGLIGWGWYGYSRNGALAPVFTVGGALLFFTIVLETHEHFAALPTVPAYFLLTGVAVAMAAISHLYRLALPVFVGTLGMSLAGVALDFPSPTFPYLFTLLLIANIIGTFATRLQRCTWLRWVLLIITVFMAQVWSMRLGMYLGRQPTEDLPFAVSGFFLAVIVIGLVYLFIAIAGMLGRITERISRFDFALPTINVLWAYLAARHVVIAGMGTEAALGVVGVMVAIAHAGVAWWLSRREVEGAPGTSSFVLAAAVLMVMALPAAMEGEFIALAILSALAVYAAHLSREWGNAGIRLTSYLVQVYAGGKLVLLLQAKEISAPSAGGAAASVAVTALAFYLYLWARRHPPERGAKVFGRFDEKDRSATVVLLTALICGFFTLRVGLYQALDLNLAAAQLNTAFSAAQSVLINLTAVALMVYAYSRRNREFRNVAVLVLLIGGAKVFLADLLAIKGLAIVASVFSFGVAALFASFALSRWQRDGPTSSKGSPAAQEESAEKAG